MSAVDTTIDLREVDWGEVYDEYRERIRNYILHKTSDIIIAEDLTSDVFVKAITFAREGAARIATLSGWLFRIARNTIVDYYGNRDRWRIIVTDESLDDMWDLSDPSQDAQAKLEGLAQIDAIQQALERLPDEQAEAIRLRFFENLGFREIGECMGRSAGAAKALQCRALVDLRKRLFAGADRIIEPRRLCIPEVIGVLTKRGPATVGGISALIPGESPQNVQDAIAKGGDIFYVVSVRTRGPRRTVSTWGLTGIHSKGESS